ncbi:MAG: transcriptional regulator [Proteobacteria bacterium]|nr:MAG: transcriptional regulator [Pseudomonadota bacterium]
MLLTKASEYALLSLMLIAQKKTPQDVDTLSKQLDISKSFLAKILQSLAREGILKSFKGAKGGFLLAEKMENMSIKNILECAEKKPAVVFECASSEGDCPNNRASMCKVWPFFNKFQTKIDDFLDNMTLKDLLEE